MNNEHYVFYDKDGKEHDIGSIAYVWYEDRGNGAVEKLGECALENLQELKIIFDYIKKQFPGGWTMENGKVEAVKRQEITELNGIKL